MGGEIFVPKIPSYRILDVVEAIAPKRKIEVVGIRPGEKLHEKMITQSDSLNTVDLEKYYAILPSGDMSIMDTYLESGKAVKVPEGFRYSSDANKEWLTIEQLRELIKKHVDPNFKVAS